MSRPFPSFKLSYYPLPVEEAGNLRALLISCGAYSAIDPCAGDGTALVEITTKTTMPTSLPLNSMRTARPQAHRRGSPQCTAVLSNAASGGDLSASVPQSTVQQRTGAAP